MAYGLKYEMRFNEHASIIAGTPCEVLVKIYQEGFSGSELELIPAENPLTVSENNNDEAIFSPIRAKEVSVSFVTDNNVYPSVEDFITTNDNDYKAEIYVDSVLWLTTLLLPDQANEEWFTDNTNHVITLVFTDNLGALKSIPLPGFIPTEKPLLYELVKAACGQAIDGLPIQIFDNLFEIDMDDRTVDPANCPYSQTRVDCRTFVKNFVDFEDCYQVLTKILESRNATLFQHLGKWVIVRVPELFKNSSVDGTEYDTDDNQTDIVWTSTATISQAGNIVPVEQYMLKTYMNALKYNKVIFNYENFEELFCNQLWKRGALVSETSTEKEYEVECWNHYRGATNSTTAASVDFGRRVEIDAATEQVKDEYLFLERETLSSGESFVRSEYCLVNASDKLTISFHRRTKNGYTGSGNEILGRVLLYANDATYYTLDDDGVWYLSNSTFTTNNKFLYHPYAASEDRNIWITKEVNSDFIPKTGKIVIHLQEGAADASADQETWFKDLRVTYLVYLEGKTFINVIGDYHKLTLTANLKESKDTIVYLSDSPKFLVKGALFQADGETLTTLWHLSGESIEYPVKRWHAIERYRMSRRPMQKAEGSFYKWLKSLVPITSLERVQFVNGAPNKRFLPLMTRDLDCSRSQFGSLFIEVYDSVLSVANSFTTTATFFVGLKQIFVPVQNDFLIPGNTITVSGTTLNDGTFTILTIGRVDVSGVLSTYIYTAEDTAEELEVANVTFTAANANGDDIFAEHEFEYIYKSER